MAATDWELKERLQKEAAARARQELVKQSQQTTASMGGWKWDRDEVNDRFQDPQNCSEQ